MVVAGFDGTDQFSHAVAGDCGVLELVAAGADGHIEAVERRAVVDRDPVVGDVIHTDNASRLVGQAQFGHAPGEPQHVGLPLLAGEILRAVVDLVGAEPFQVVHVQLERTDQDVVAHFGSHVAAAVVIGHRRTHALEVDACRRGHVVHLFALRSGADCHVIQHPCQLVDGAAVRAGHIHHDRRRQHCAAGQHDTLGAAGACDPSDGLAEAELGSSGFGRQPQIVGCELRIADVARFWGPQRAVELRRGLGPEIGMCDLHGRTEA